MSHIVTKTRIAAACDEESTRYALGSVQAVPAGKDRVWLTATDGRCFAAVETDGTLDDGPELIPAKVFPTRKAHFPKCIPAALDRTNGVWKNNRKTPTIAEPSDGRFPKTADVVKDITEVDASERRTVTIDAKLLLNIQEALSDNDSPEKECVTLLLSDNNENSIGIVGNAGIGVLMPCSGGDKAGEKWIAQRESYLAAHK